MLTTITNTHARRMQRQEVLTHKQNFLTARRNMLLQRVSRGFSGTKEHENKWYRNNLNFNLGRREHYYYFKGGRENFNKLFNGYTGTLVVFSKGTREQEPPGRLSSQIIQLTIQVFKLCMAQINILSFKIHCYVSFTNLGLHKNKMAWFLLSP